MDAAGARTGAVHVYVVPPGTISAPPLTGVIVKAAPLQIVAVLFAIVALGFTVTVTVKVAPAQVPDIGVTVYVAVATALVVFVSVWLMLA
ncbi:MAG: hypothetical protein IPN67_19440 [Bacteroidales bacterium]|nr:hypothetical protein [Bacteroidales bacterium]